MAFSWVNCALRELKKLKNRRLLFMKQGNKSEADKLDRRIKQLSDEFGKA